MERINKIWLVILVLLMALHFSHAQVRWDLSIGYLPESEETAYFDPPDRFSGLGSAVLLKANPLFELGDYFIGGPYISLVPGVEIFRFDESPMWLELGVDIGPRFQIADHELRGLAQIGFRRWITDNEFLASNGLATNLNISFEFNVDKSLSPKAEIGFLTQPTGGNEDVFISFSPYWYIGGGIVLK